MPSVCRIGDICNGHPNVPPRPCIEGSPNVFANGLAVHRQGDAWDIHGNHGGVLSSGSSTVFVNGKELGRVGDPISCGTTVATGSPDVFAGG